MKDRLKYREIAAADLQHERALLKSEMERVQKVMCCALDHLPWSHHVQAFLSGRNKTGMDTLRHGQLLLRP